MIKSLKLASYNWKALLKSILYQVLLLALVIAIAFMIFGGLVDDFVRIFNENHVTDFFYNTINSVVSAEFNGDQFATELGALISNVRQSVSSVQLSWGGVTVTYILFIVIIVVYRMLVSITDVAVGSQIEEFMTSNAERPFTWYFVKKQGKSWQFVLLQTAFVLPLEILIVCGSVGFYMLLMFAVRWWAIIPMAILALLFYVARLSIFAYCLPSVVCQPELSTRQAFKQGLSLAVTRFWHIFWKTFIVVCLMAVVSVISIMFVDNAILSAVLTTVPNFALYFYLKCVNMVDYFRADNRPYFYKRVEIEGTERYNKIQARKARRAK